MRRLASLLTTLTVASASLLLAPATPVLAATCTVTTTSDGRPYVAPTGSGAGTGKKVGFDNTHGSTAGAADWTIDGAMSDFACGLAGQGYAVEEIRAYPLTATNLGAYNVVIIPEPNIPFTTAEEQALASYVAGGKGLLMIADHYQADRNFNTWDATEVFNGWRRGHYQATYTSPYYWYNGTTTSTTYTFNNEDDWMATNFGMRFHFNAMDMASGVTGFIAGNPSDPDDPGILAASQTFNITSGVTSVSSHAGATLAITDPTKAMGIVFPNKSKLVRWSSAQSTDPIALYTDTVGTTACGSATMGGRCEGAYVAVAKPNAGKVAAIGDSSAWEDATPKYKREDTGGTKTTHAGWGEVNNATLGINLVNWLATSDPSVGIPAGQQQQVSPEPYNVFTISEPLAEPWSTSSNTSYKWYDARTFNASAYKNTTLYGGGGGGGGDTTAPTVSITAPTAGATVSGTTTVSASASDNVGVTKVEFYLDGALQSTDTTSPYSWSWDTTTAANGSHSLTAKAYDAANNVATSTAVSVTVSNSGSSTANETFTGHVDGTTTTQDFWIDVTATGTISLNLSWTVTSNLNIYLYNPSGTQVASKSGSTSPLALTYNATTTGRYKIHITRSSGGSDYTLTASHPINPNVTGTYSQSGSLAAGGFTTYTLTVGAAGTIDLKLSFPAGTDFDLYLLNSSGTTVAAAETSTLNPETISYQVSGPGTYTVEVDAYSGSGSFTVSGYYPK
ncbi:MAG TPA: Ig-like domain-containing protein [Symbiobacteriaceae bacterium]|nr:Ig-like domain-containing protein [Symbiobacteriaceae bacterium]